MSPRSLTLASATHAIAGALETMANRLQKVLAPAGEPPDDYSLNVANLPMAQPSPTMPSLDGEKSLRARVAVNVAQGGLFERGDGRDV